MTSDQDCWAVRCRRVEGRLGGREVQQAEWAGLSLGERGRGRGRRRMRKRRIIKELMVEVGGRLA